MAIGSPEFSVLPFTFGLADFISSPFRTALPKKLVLSHKSVGIMGRGGERSAVNRIKTMSGTPVVKTV